MSERAVLVGLRLAGSKRAAREESLEELKLLTSSAGGDMVATIFQERETPDPRFFIGRGKVGELGELVSAHGADLVIVDAELSPAQQANLAEACGARVIDRSGLILDIFAQRARTREGKLQVELAQLDYLLPRLVGRHDRLSRLGGGIGTRGPGETKLETDRRRVKKRITVLKEELEKVKRHRALHRRRRSRNALPVAALAGYTNAGKSTLLKALTGAMVGVEDRLFSTLDPTTRRLRLPGGGTILLSDTVGFIRDIPHQLIAAFKATLEEVVGADIIVHVIDMADPRHAEQAAVVRGVLEEIGAGERRIVEVYNKLDRLEAGAFDPRWMERAHPGAVFVSARTGEGLPRLVELLDQEMRLLKRADIGTAVVAGGGEGG